MTDKILIDVRTTDLTLSQAIAYAEAYARAHPHDEVFLDGDAYAIVAREVVG